MTRLNAGDEAPHFKLLDGEDRVWDLSELKGRKVILFFYPADDTPGCTVEACDFRDSLSELNDAGYVVLGISPQGAESHQRFSAKYSLNFPLLVDEDREVAMAYGAADDSGRLFKGIPLRVKRTTFVINEDGVIDQALYRVRAKGHVDSLKEALLT